LQTSGSVGTQIPVALHVPHGPKPQGVPGGWCDSTHVSDGASQIAVWQMSVNGRGCSTQLPPPSHTAQAPQSTPRARGVSAHVSVVGSQPATCMHAGTTGGVSTQAPVASQRWQSPQSVPAGASAALQVSLAASQ